MAKMGVREYARHRGVSHVAVLRAMAERIASAVTRDERGKPHIDPDEADRLWVANTDQAQQREPESQRKPAVNGTTATKDMFGQDEGKRKAQESAALATRTFQSAKAMREGLRAKITALELQKMEGTLVSADEVKTAAYRTARAVRDALLNIPQRIDTELAGIQDPHEIRQVLEREFLTVLGKLSNPDADAEE